MREHVCYMLCLVLSTAQHSTAQHTHTACQHHVGPLQIKHACARASEQGMRAVACPKRIADEPRARESLMSHMQHSVRLRPPLLPLPPALRCSSPSLCWQRGSESHPDPPGSAGLCDRRHARHTCKGATLMHTAVTTQRPMHHSRVLQDVTAADDQQLHCNASPVNNCCRRPVFILPAQAC
jgi:hypothetical protein